MSDDANQPIKRHYKKSLEKEFSTLYLDQKRRNSEEERKTKFIKRWGWLCSCCF